jgi:hypothetical protein
MPKKQAASEGMVLVRCLSDSSVGLCGDVVQVPAGLVPQLKAIVAVDDDPESVAYAMTLPQNQPAEASAEQ